MSGWILQNDLDHIASVCWQLERLIRIRREKFEAIGAVTNEVKMVPFYDARHIVFGSKELVCQITDVHQCFDETFSSIWLGEDLYHVKQAFDSKNPSV